MASRGAFLLPMAMVACSDPPSSSPLYDASTLPPRDSGSDVVDEVSYPAYYECADGGPDSAETGATDAADAGSWPCPKANLLVGDASPIGHLCDEVRATVEGDWSSVGADLCRAGVSYCRSISDDGDPPRLLCHVPVHRYIAESDLALVCGVAALPFVEQVGCVVWK